MSRNYKWENDLYESNNDHWSCGLDIDIKAERNNESTYPPLNALGVENDFEESNHIELDIKCKINLLNESNISDDH